MGQNQALDVWWGKEPVLRSQEPDPRLRGLKAETVIEVPLFTNGLHDHWDLGFCSAARPQPTIATYPDRSFISSQNEARSRQGWWSFVSGPRDPGSFELRALPSSESPDGHPQPDFTSAFRQEAARRQGGDCVWSQSSPSSRHPATCNSLVSLTPAAGETRKWGGPEQTPGGEVEGGRGASSQAGCAGVWYLPAHLSWVPVQWGHSDFHGV